MEEDLYILSKFFNLAKDKDNNIMTDKNIGFTLPNVGEYEKSILSEFDDETIKLDDKPKKKRGSKKNSLSEDIIHKKSMNSSTEENKENLTKLEEEEEDKPKKKRGSKKNVSNLDNEINNIKEEENDKPINSQEIISSLNITNQLIKSMIETNKEMIKHMYQPEIIKSLKTITEIKKQKLEYITKKDRSYNKIVDAIDSYDNDRKRIVVIIPGKNGENRTITKEELFEMIGDKEICIYNNINDLVKNPEHAITEDFTDF